VRVAFGIFNVVLGVLLLASVRWLGPQVFMDAASRVLSLTVKLAGFGDPPDGA
jgi:hypothetical protein